MQDKSDFVYVLYVFRKCKLKCTKAYTDNLSTAFQCMCDKAALKDKHYMIKWLCRIKRKASPFTVLFNTFKFVVSGEEYHVTL